MKFQYSPLTTTGAGRNSRARATQVRERTAKGNASPKFSAGGKDGRARAEYYMAWDTSGVNIPQAELDFIGFSRTNFDGSGNVTGINRTIPYPHPLRPNRLYCDDIDVEPDVPAGKDALSVAAYDEGKISATFSTRDYVIGDDGIVDESKLTQYVKIAPKTNARYERLPSSAALSWLNPAPGRPQAEKRPVSNAQAVVLCEGEVSITWHQVPVEAIPWNAISTCIGCCDQAAALAVNAINFDFLAQSYISPVLQTNLGQNGKRQLPCFVCLTPDISDPYPMVSGNGTGGNNFAVDIKYIFKFYPFGANSFYRFETGRFEAAVSPRPQLNNELFAGFYKSARFQTLFLGS